MSLLMEKFGFFLLPFLFFRDGFLGEGGEGFEGCVSIGVYVCFSLAVFFLGSLLATFTNRGGWGRALGFFWGGWIRNQLDIYPAASM